MRKIFLLLFAGMVVFGCKDAVTPTDPNDPNNPNNPTDPLEVQRVQNVFAINFSGTWCGPCGQNGIPALYAAATAHGSKFNGIKVGLNGQGSPDPFFISSGSQLAQIFYPPNENGIPGFAAGTTFFNSGGISAWRARIDEIIATPTASVKAGLALTKEVKGDSLYFNVRMKTFANLPTGLYSIGVVVVEDGLVSSQVGQTANPFTHKMVYRGFALIPFTMNFGIWGHAVNDTPGPIAANTTIERRMGYAKPAGLNPAVNLNNAYGYAILTRLDPITMAPLEIINSSKSK